MHLRTYCTMSPVLSGAVSSLSFFCLLVLLFPASHGASSHASYRLGARQVFFKTPGRSQQDSMAPPAITCPTLATGNNKLPVVHRRNPCSPLKGLQSLTMADMLRRDASLIQHRFSSQSSLVAAVGSSSAPASTIIPVNASTDSVLAPLLDYSVLVSFGTPEQQFPMYLRTRRIPASVLRCKPCVSGSEDCDPAFDTLRSSTFSRILCGSPDCPTNNCTSGSYCSLNDEYYENGTFAEDVLTLAPSMAIDNFRFFCKDVDKPLKHRLEGPAGSLNLGKGRNSLPSQLYSSKMAAATTFSYCLPRSPSSLGFLSLGIDDYNATTHAPLVSSIDPELANLYFVDVVGMSLGGEDLPIPAGTFGNNDTSLLDVDKTFTYLKPSVYIPLRDSFRKQMSQYNNLTLRAGADDFFDTCFNFTGLQEVNVPLVEFKFSNGESLVIDGEQMMYYPDPDAAPFTTACLAFSSLDAGDSYSALIGTYALASTEVVYDVAGGKVGFIPWRC